MPLKLYLLLFGVLTYSVDIYFCLVDINLILQVKKIDRQITKLRKSGNGAWERDVIELLNADRKRIFYIPE
jgi:hypothetical protein